jgi:hypothetical protein
VNLPIIIFLSVLFYRFLLFCRSGFRKQGAPNDEDFCSAGKAIFRSNPWWIARESNAVCEQKDRPGGVQ